VLVLPALTLNYFGQGALLLTNPKALENPFFLMFPNWALAPMVALATLATVIASQAVISGAFSMTKQAVQLGFMPRMAILHTSVRDVGQIYVPAVNTALLIAVIAAVMGFRSSTALGAAYGIAVTGTMMITTVLTFFVIRYSWHYPWWLCVGATAFFVLIDAMFFSANLLKIVDGGWFPLAIGALIFFGMVTWAKGRELLSTSLRADAIELKPFMKNVLADPPMRAPGTAVFLNGEADLTPTALLHNLKHNYVLHETNLFVTVHTLEVPGARIGGSASTFFMNGLSSIASARRLMLSSSRPLAQVTMPMKINAPIASGNQPPSMIFSRFALKKVASISTKNAVAPIHSHHG
jgi:KUP system potassium uptake protein